MAHAGWGKERPERKVNYGTVISEIAAFLWQEGEGFERSSFWCMTKPEPPRIGILLTEDQGKNDSIQPQKKKEDLADEALRVTIV